MYNQFYINQYSDNKNNIATYQESESESESESSVPVPKAWEIDSCYRVRRNILSLNDDELMILIEGMQAIKANGMYDRIAFLHPAKFRDYHGNSFFFPWHRWYIYLIESAIRQLGGRFSCFALPYWNWTFDAGN